MEEINEFLKENNIPLNDHVAIIENSLIVDCAITLENITINKLSETVLRSFKVKSWDYWNLWDGTYLEFTLQ